MGLRRFDGYVLRQVLAGTVGAVFLLSLVLVLGNIFQEVRELLVEKGVPIGVLLEFILLVLPFSLIYTLPWGFLVAVLLVFGRLSAHQELVGVRSGGMSLWRVALPVWGLGLGLSFFCLYLQGTVAPRAKDAQKELLFRVLREDPFRLLDPGVVQSQLKGQKIFIEGREGNSLRGFHAYQLSSEEREAAPVGYVYASQVSLVNEEQAQRLHLRLEGAYGEAYQEGGQVRHLYTDEAEPWLADYSKGAQRRRKADAMDNAEIVRRLTGTWDEPKGEEGQVEIPARLATPEALRFELSRRTSFSMAPLAMALIAVPLAVGQRRRETSVGLVMSIGVAFAYFLAMILVEDLEGGAAGLREALLWLPNVVCVLLGAWWMRQVSRRA